MSVPAKIRSVSSAKAKTALPELLEIRVISETKNYCLLQNPFFRPTGSTGWCVQLFRIQNGQLLEPEESEGEQAGKANRAKDEDIAVVDQVFPCEPGEQPLKRSVKGWQDMWIVEQKRRLLLFTFGRHFLVVLKIDVFVVGLW
jgi:hypothetical protein